MFASGKLAVAVYKCKMCDNSIEFSQPAEGSTGRCSVCGDVFRFPVRGRYVTHTFDQVHANRQQTISPGIAALLSFFLPGLGQMCKGQVVVGIAWLIGTVVGYMAFFVPGFIMHIICVVHAAQG